MGSPLRCQALSLRAPTRTLQACRCTANACPARSACLSCRCAAQGAALFDYTWSASGQNRCAQARPLNSSPAGWCSARPAAAAQAVQQGRLHAGRPPAAARARGHDGRQVGAAGCRQGLAATWHPTSTPLARSRLRVASSRRCWSLALPRPSLVSSGLSGPKNPVGACRSSMSLPRPI